MNDDLKEIAGRVLIVCFAVTWLVILWRSHRNPAYANFSIVGYISTKDGFPDRAATGEVMALLAMTTWGTVMVLRNQMSDWFVGAYVASFVARGGYAAYLKATHPPEPGSVTTSSSSSSTTSTQGG